MMRYESGQVWRYSTQEGEEDTRILILKSERINSTDIVHITVFGNKYDDLGHIPFEKVAIDKSVIELERENTAIPDYQEGYEIWKKLYLTGDAGIYNTSVADVLSL